MLVCRPHFDVGSKSFITYFKLSPPLTGISDATDNRVIFQQLDIEVFGEPSSYVGLIGVNAAIGLIEKDFAPVDFVNSATVSRKKLFNILRSNAQRCGKTTTPFTESAFPSVGKVSVGSLILC